LKLKNNTFQNIELIKPRYFGVCYECDEVWLLHCAKSLLEGSPEWICPHCENKLDIIKLGKKAKVVVDIIKYIRFKIMRPKLGLF